MGNCEHINVKPYSRNYYRCLDCGAPISGSDLYERTLGELKALVPDHVLPQWYLNPGTKRLILEKEVDRLRGNCIAANKSADRMRDALQKLTDANTYGIAASVIAHDALKTPQQEGE